ncbi:hypothetical protein BC629DRAFT_1501471 [Irpex lacteus]|nr:hypothetical protein BC629DRAFT_1501471 [Irpex lacteus]
MSEFISEAKLPVELLLLVKEHILLSDLRTHVCFYNTCRTIAAFYGDNSQQNAFWRRACALSGIGWLRGDSSWKEIALETIAKDGFCTHPHCGATLLGWNAAYVERAMHNHDWDPEEGAWDGTFDSEELANQWTSPNRPLPICSPIFRHTVAAKSPATSLYGRCTLYAFVVISGSVDLPKITKIFTVAVVDTYCNAA